MSFGGRPLALGGLRGTLGFLPACSESVSDLVRERESPGITARSENIGHVTRSVCGGGRTRRSGVVIQPTQPMHSAPQRDRSRTHNRTRRARLLAPAVIVALAGLGGCEVDNWLYNPSTVGRWQHTPTIVPVLERIDVIESDTGDYVDVTQVTAEDLIPEPRDYLISPGDVIRVQVLDFVPSAGPYRDDLIVDQRGFIGLPLIDPVRVTNMSAAQAQRAIADAIIAADLIEQPQVNVQVVGQRQASFTVHGAVTGVGRYQIPNPDYRLVDALTDAGGVSPIIPKIYVIRQVPLHEDVKSGKPTPDQPKPEKPKPGSTEEGKSLIDLIEGLTTPGDAPEKHEEAPESTPTPNPGVLSMSARSTNDGSAVRPMLPGIAPEELASVLQDGNEPLIDLPDEPRSAESRAEQPEITPTMMGESASVSDDGRWVFLNGEWMKVKKVPVAEVVEQGLPETADPLANATRDANNQLVTQRVIEIPVGPLLEGVAQYNIVMRPGDIIRVPTPEQGQVYVGGPGISRPGTYNLPFTGRLTLTRLIFAAGGFTEVAIPDRVDLTRMIGTDRQATVRFNVKAIFEGTQPDIFIKSDDMLNFGTNFWALPLAVIRSGFRASYGFGFLLDRNFGNDVFGAPPAEQFFR